MCKKPICLWVLKPHFATLAISDERKRADFLAGCGEFVFGWVKWWGTYPNHRQAFRTKTHLGREPQPVLPDEARVWDPYLYMTGLSYLGILITIAALCAWLNHKFVKLPAAIGVMCVSLAFSLSLVLLESLGVVSASAAADFFKTFDFHEIVLHGLLAFLLFAGGLTVSVHELKSQRGAVAVLSTFGVIVGAGITGSVFWLLLSLIGKPIPFDVALLFGAIVSPTDAVAILGILRKVGVPKSIEIKLVGESLFNDGIGVVVFLAISSLVRGAALAPSHMALQLAVEVLGGVALGIVLGWIVYQMMKKADEYAVEILLTLSLAVGGYALAESLHVSAPICVVVAGLLIGNRGREFAMSERTREHMDVFWELVDELLNGVLFVLVGLAVLVIALSPQDVLIGALGVVALMVSRFASVSGMVVALKPFRTFSPHVIKILAWGGLRGGISVALALSLEEGPYRDLLVVSTYIVVLFSVLVQGTTLPRLLRYAKSRS